MEHHSKQIIYKGIIQYLLKSTSYTLKNIADLTNTSISSLHSIYCLNEFPDNFRAEISLLKLYQIILEINLTRNDHRLTLSAAKRN